jgi:hypothetical protein
MKIEDFYDQVKNEIIDETLQDNLDEAFKENAFTSIVSEDLASAGLLESPALCFHQFSNGNLIGKINGYAIPEDESSIDLIISDYYENDEIVKINQSDVEKRLNQAMRFFELANSDNALDSVDISSDVHGMLFEIKSKIESGLTNIRIHLITNALNVARNYKIEKEIKGYQVLFDVFDLERFRRFRESGATQEKIEINLLDFNDGKGIPCASFVHDDYYDTALVILPGELLYKLYDDFGSRLLELNVRAYLQARGKVNKGILQTLINEPEKFLTYNNGITMVAEKIEFNEDRTEIIKLLGMQIVNGGQTTASIHRAKKDNNSSLDLVKVQAKITMVPENHFEKVVPLISKYSNTQNKVNEVDLNANHPFHQAVERISRKVYTPDQTSKWFYERSRGSYQTEKFKAKTPAQKNKFNKEYPVNQKISKEDAAKYYNMWNELPHFVSRGGQKNFVRFMNDLSSDIKKDWEMPKEDFQDLVAKAILYKQTQSIARQKEIPAFRVNVVNYTTSLLIYKTAKRMNLQNIWNAQALSSDIENILNEWIPKVYKILLDIAEGKNPGEVFKKNECWEKLQELTRDWDINSLDKKNLKTTAMNENLSVEADNDIARCMEIRPELWSKLAQWGEQTGKLHYSQTGIAMTLFRMASSNWSKPPSEKQAKSGMKIVNTFKEYEKEQSN